jgi:hypothetical protein
MLLDGGTVSAASRSGKNQIRPAESSAPQRLVIGKYPAGIPLERCGRIECDPLTSEIKCQAPGTGSGWGARPAATRAFMDDDAIEHHMTLF